MKSLAALLALAAALTGAPLPRPYTVEHYDVHLTPDLAAQHIAGEVTIRLRSQIDRLDAVELDRLARNLQRPRKPARTLL